MRPPCTRGQGWSGAGMWHCGQQHRPTTTCRTIHGAGWVDSFVLTVTRREGATQIQNGQVNVTILNGNTVGSALVSYPSAYAVGRNVVVCSQDVRFWATCWSIGNTGFT